MCLKSDNTFAVPVGFAACRWLWGICGQCFVETAVAATGAAVAAAAAAVAAAVGVSGEPLAEPNREKYILRFQKETDRNAWSRYATVKAP